MADLKPGQAPAAPRLMTFAAYGRHRGTDNRQNVLRWKKRGEIVVVENDKGREMVDVDASDAMLDTLQNPLKTQTGTDVKPIQTRTDTTTQDKTKNARAAKEMADAAMSQIKYQQMAGNLIPRDELRDVGPAAAAMLQQHMTRRRGELAQRLLACQSERELIAALRESDYALLNTFAESLQAYDNLAAGLTEMAAAG